MPTLFSLSQVMSARPRMYQSILRGRLACFNCGQRILPCPCRGLDYGEDLQFYAPPETHSTAERLVLWADMIEAHPRMQLPLFREAVNDTVAFVHEHVGSLIEALPAMRPKIQRAWRAFTRDRDQLVLLRRQHMDVWSVPLLKTIGDEAIDSFFTGRWYEMTAIGCLILALVMESSGIVPETSGPQMIEVGSSFAWVSDRLNDISRKNGFTLMAPSSSLRLKQMAVFKPLLKFHSDGH
ncbi:hypothetical protein DFJ73DRAFT_807727 [Zopfochytrium polystomum]|nr:hypothetical protein DFJ73DRAFT_807727 [Zopfochytrium polystomum]